MLKVEFRQNVSDFGYVVWVYYENPDGSMNVVKDLKTWEAERIQPGAMVDPSFTAFTTRGDGNFIQAFVDAAYELGIRPSGEPVLKNELTATKAHLTDLRALLFTSTIKREASPMARAASVDEI